ncbi:hypothetical protein LXL04_023219 [Taraxacum kok-saghyz]
MGFFNRPIARELNLGGQSPWEKEASILSQFLMNNLVNTVSLGNSWSGNDSIFGQYCIARTVRFSQLNITRVSSISMLELTSALVFSCPPTNSFSNNLSQPNMDNDLSFCSPPVGRETDVIDSQKSILKSSMLSGQLKTSMLSHPTTSILLRDVRLLPQSSSSFSPNLTNFEHQYTFNFLKFKRTLLAFASDSHKYLISLHVLRLTSSTAPRCSTTPPHT